MKRRSRSLIAGIAGLVTGMVVAVVHLPTPVLAAPEPPVQTVGWGMNLSGVLGEGPASPRPLPVVLARHADNFRQVNISYSHGLALDADGRVWAWGNNQFGQLGDGTRTSRSAPQLVPRLTNIVHVSAGFFFSVALDAQGRVFTWGTNVDGEIGRGEQGGGDQLDPFLIPSISGVVQLDAGPGSVLARRSDGSLWQWGRNPGLSFDDILSPQLMMSPQLHDVIDVAAEGLYMLALRTDGTVVGWGFNFSGQLGGGNPSIVEVPTPIGPALPGLTDIDAGGGHVLALRNDGSVWAWGANHHGEAGRAAPATIGAPVQVLNGVRQISAGTHSSFALKRDSTLWVWGRNDDGQLGIGGDLSIKRFTPVQVTAVDGVVALSRGLMGRAALALRTDQPLHEIRLTSSSGTLTPNVSSSGTRTPNTNAAPSGGGAVVVSILTEAAYGYGGQIFLSVNASGLPPGVTAEFSPQVVYPGQTSVLTLSGTTLEYGSFDLTITAATAVPARQVTAPFTLHVADPPQDDPVE